MARIEHIEARCWRVPLDETLHDAKHGAHTHFELVTARVRLSYGLEGSGYTYTGGRGGRAILAVIEHDLQPFLLGQPADAERGDGLAPALRGPRRHRGLCHLGH